MKITLIPTLIVLFSLTIVPMVTAGNQVADSEVTNNLKERLKEVVTGTEINEVSEPKLSGYIGQVTDIIQNTIILEDKEGKKSVRVDDDSTILRSPGSKEIDLESVRIEDSIIAIGVPSADDEITGRRIIVSTTALTPPDKISGIATISSIDKYSFSLTVAGQEDPFKLFFTSSTVYKSPSTILDQEDLSVGDEILYTAARDKDDDWSATIVMQIKPTNTPTESE